MHDAHTIANEIADTFGAESLTHFADIVDRFAGHRSPVELRDGILEAQRLGLLAVNGQTVSVCPR